MNNQQQPIILCLLLAASSAWAQPWAAPEEKMHRGPDPVGRIELGRPRDPTFESVASHYPMLDLPREALGVFESAREFVVTRWGELVVNNLGMEKPGQPEAYPNNSPENVATLYFTLRCGDGPETRYGEGNPPDAKRLVEGHLPIVLVPFTHGGVECVQTLFAWAQDMDPDARLWAYAGLELRNRAATKMRVALAHRAECGRRARRVQTGSWELELGAGEARRLCVRIPRDGIVPDTGITAESPEYKKRGANARLPFCRGFEGVEPVAPAEFDRRLAEVADAWRARLGGGMTIRTPEQRVNDAYRAWLAYGFINVDKEGDRTLPHDGSGFYELVWGIAAIQFCRALDLYGFHEHARRCLDSICTLVDRSGELKTYFGLSDSGTLLVALRDHYNLTRDRAWLDSAAPTIVRICDWTIARRSAEKRTQAPESPWFGLIKYRPSGDYPEPDYNFLSDAALCVGLDAAAQALAVAGRDGDARRIGAEAAAYRCDIDAAMRRGVFTHEGARLLPILPASRGWLVKARYGATGYYSLFASLLLDTEYLAPADPHADLLIDALERRGGLCAGLCTFFSWIDHGFTYGYWLHMLKRAEPRKAILGLYGSLAYGMSRNTYSGVELTTIATGANQRTLPHLRSGTQQLRLLRNLLVREEGDRLLLAQATPQHWLAPGGKVEVRNAPTAFGPVSYTIDSAADRGRIAVTLTPPTRNPPAAIELFVRHPDGKPIREALVDGAPGEGAGPDRVILRNVARPVRLEVRYANP